MDSKNLLEGFSQQGKSKVVIINNDEKIEVEIREIVRIKPQDFASLKDSFEEWAKSWE